MLHKSNRRFRGGKSTFKLLRHPPYSQFALHGKWLAGRPGTTIIFYNGIRALEKRWTNCVSVAWDYVEKWQNMMCVSRIVNCVMLRTFWTPLVESPYVTYYVINSRPNLYRISHRFRDMADYWSNFYYRQRSASLRSGWTPEIQDCEI